MARNIGHVYVDIALTKLMLISTMLDLGKPLLAVAFAISLAASLIGAFKSFRVEKEGYPE